VRIARQHTSQEEKEGNSHFCGPSKEMAQMRREIIMLSTKKK
jgi:hypothetical protein